VRESPKERENREICIEIIHNGVVRTDDDVFDLLMMLPFICSCSCRNKNRIQRSICLQEGTYHKRLLPEAMFSGTLGL
jgi:hypothetical protein